MEQFVSSISEEAGNQVRKKTSIQGKESRKSIEGLKYVGKDQKKQKRTIGS